MKSLLTAATALLLTGCGLFGGTRPPDVQVIERAVPVVCDLSARPDALQLGDTPPTLVLNGEDWGYWFSPDLYAVLAENLQAMRRWMNQSADIRDKLAECIVAHNEASKTAEH